MNYHVADYANAMGVGAIVATLAGLLPPFAAFVALVWYIIQIKESETFKAWRARRRAEQIKRVEAHLAQLRRHHNVPERSDT